MPRDDHRLIRNRASEDRQAAVLTPPGIRKAQSERASGPGADAKDERPTARVRRRRQVNVLACTANPRVQRIVDELRTGAGIATYELVSVTDRARARTLLCEPSWDAFVLDEEGCTALDALPEADRLRILSSAVVITEGGAAALAQVSAAECIPGKRISRFALDDALCRVARRKMAGGKPKERETLADVLWGIARRNLLAHTDLAASFRPLVETAAHLLHLGRASVWRFLDNPRRMRCEAMYIAATGEFTGDIEVPAASCPGYCSAMQNHRILAIQDALRDPRSSEIAPYLVEAGIGALLDAPVYLNGEVVGLFCCAHVGGTRAWTEAEQYIAASFSDYAQLVLMAHQRRKAEEVVLAQRQRMQQGQRLEILGAIADMAIGRCQSQFATINATVQQLLRADAGQLPAEVHGRLLTVLAACESGSQVVNQVKSYSPTAAPAVAAPGPTSAAEAAVAACAMVRSLNTRDLAFEATLMRDRGSVACDPAALRSALFSMAYHGLQQAPDGGRLALSCQELPLDGQQRGIVEFAAVCSAWLPVREFESGMVLVSNFAATVGAQLEVCHVDAGTRASLRIPRSGTGHQLRPRDDLAIILVADDEEPTEILDMLRFFRYNSVLLRTQDALAHLREQRANVGLVVLDAANSQLPLQERLGAMRLATTRPILIVGPPELSVGIPSNDVRLKVLSGSSLVAIAAHIEQVLQGASRAG